MKSLLVFSLIIGCNLSCDLADDIAGCDFDSIFLVNPRTGFIIAEENCGIEIDKSTFAEQPYVFYPNAREDLKYTLIMVDNDDPFTEEGRDFLQWMVINIDGTSLKYGVVGESYGEIMAAYIPPDPSEDCTHRYSIYIYEQIFSPLKFPELPPTRSEFILQDFVESVISCDGDGAFCDPIASIEFKSRF